MKYLLAILIAVSPGLGAAAWGQAALDDDRAMIEGLLSRQLYELAQRYVAERIISPDATPRQQAEMAAQLIRTYSLQAQNSRPSERDRWWRRADEVVPQFERQFPEHPAAALVSVQDTLARLARVRLLRQEGEVLAEAEKMATAREQVVQVIERLETLQQEVDQQLRAAHNERQHPGGLTPEELLALSRRVTLHAAEALEQQGLAFPPDSLDRTSGMTLALQKVEPLTRLRPDTQVLWPALLLEMRALRHLERLDEAEAKIAQLQERLPPAEVALEAKAEQVRIQLDRGQLPEAIRLIDQGREIEGHVSAELDFACFETYLALWKEAEEEGATDAVKMWQDRAAAVVGELDQLHGPYWARRAEQRLTGRATAGGTENLALLQRTAEGYVRQKQWDEAIKNYDLAIQTARQSNLTDQEYQLRLASAAAAVEAGNLPAAVKRFREAAMAFPAAKDAPLQHLNAAYFQSLVARQASPPQLEPYVELLEENLRLWATGEAAEQAALWLGQIEFSRGNWRKATQAYIKVPSGSPHFAQAIDGARQSALHWFQHESAKDQLVPQDVRQVIDYFEGVIVAGQEAEDAWTSTMRVAAETAAQLWLNYVEGGYANAQAVLEVALRSDPAAPQGWRTRLESLQVIALTGMGKLSEARGKLQDVQSDSPTSLFEVLQALEQMADSSSAAVRQQIAELQLLVIQMLKPNLDQLDQMTGRAIKVQEAEALATSGDLAGGIAIYEQLAAQYPADFEIQLGQARMLSRGTSQTLLEQALGCWRDLSRKSRTQSQPWYEAKLEIARLHARLGDPKQAQQMIRYLETLYPDLGGPEMKARFVQLSKELANTGS